MTYAVRVAVAGFLLGGCRPAPETAHPSGAVAWTQLVDELPGRWRASVDGHAIEVTYRLTARGSVVVETWMPGTAGETVTTYHLDGETLMLTHYCGQRNQPRLRLTAHGENLLFSRFDATDLQPEEAVLTRLTLVLRGTALSRTETYVQGEQRETTELVFTRIDD